MRTGFGWNRLAPSQHICFEHLDDAGVANRDVQMTQGGVEEHDVRNPYDRVRLL